MYCRILNQHLSAYKAFFGHVDKPGATLSTQTIHMQQVQQCVVAPLSKSLPSFLPSQCSGAGAGGHAEPTAAGSTTKNVDRR